MISHNKNSVKFTKDTKIKQFTRLKGEENFTEETVTGIYSSRNYYPNGHVEVTFDFPEEYVNKEIELYYEYEGLKSNIITVKTLNYIERKLGVRNFKKIFKSITCDNGTEFSNTMGMEYSPISGKQRTIVYYCHPYCSSERGSNENQNAFIRRFIPKGTPISKYSLTEIKEIQDFINDYPRGIFDYKTSNELFDIELEALGIEKNSIIF